MAGTLKPAAIRAAQRFDNANLALSGGLIWARYFDGGDDAYRAIACAILRRDRDHRKSARPMEEHMVRHDLNEHATVSVDEATAINRHLDAIGAEDLNLHMVAWATRMPWNWRPWQPIDSFPTSVDAAHAFAASDWSEADVASYAAAWLRFSSDARARLAVPAGSVLAEIVRAAPGEAES